MEIKRDTTKALHREIRKRYQSMADSGKFSKRFMLETVAEELFRSPSYVERVVYTKAEK